MGKSYKSDNYDRQKRTKNEHREQRRAEKEKLKYFGFSYNTSKGKSLNTSEGNQDADSEYHNYR